VSETFISWSRDRSRRLAEALTKLISAEIGPRVRWSPDLPKGGSWFSNLAGYLEGARAGIICITPENQDSPWRRRSPALSPIVAVAKRNASIQFRVASPVPVLRRSVVTSRVGETRTVDGITERASTDSPAIQPRNWKTFPPSAVRAAKARSRQFPP